jgi:hypothetical protein
MRTLTEQDFVDIATAKTDGIVILSTPTCGKCATLKKQIDASEYPEQFA